MRNLLLALIIALFASCNGVRKEPSSDKSQQQQTEQSLQDANKQIGMPAIVNFQERKLFKQILELRDQEKLITYCYLVNEISGKVGQFLGKGIGYGIPAATQFTSPQKLVDVTHYGIDSYQSNDAAVIPQADPNGLFMPTATSATWYMLLDKKGKPHPVYIEPLIIVSPIKLH
ncbi:hypothetical protein [Tenacibaculum piscium]|uniref:hypothetical protein n=1 Tax=Tenacibaculum piscium TaxID=1458515 RepID=UPI0023B9F588|nr:hypothetical protein [Tenacibaculum piscium]